MQVRTTPDGTVVIEGKHEERTSPNAPSDASVRNYNAVQQQFSRQFTLPQGCEPMRVISNLSRDGVLIVTAPKKASSSASYASASTPSYANASTPSSSPYSSSSSPYATSSSSSRPSYTSSRPGASSTSSAYDSLSSAPSYRSSRFSKDNDAPLSGGSGYKRRTTTTTTKSTSEDGGAPRTTTRTTTVTSGGDKEVPITR